MEFKKPGSSRLHFTQIRRMRNLDMVEEIHKQVKTQTEEGKPLDHNDLIRSIIRNIGCTWSKAEEYLHDLGLGEE